MRIRTLLSSIIFSTLAIVIALPAQGTSLSIASLSQAKGPTSGGNSIILHGTDFIKNESDKIINILEGSTHVLALTSSGKVYTWGLNLYGQLGTNDYVDYGTPQDITDQFNGEIITKIGTGLESSYAISESGKVFAWGRNDYGQLGSGDTVNRNAPIDITSSFSGLVTKIIGGTGHTLALTNQGKVYSWGQNNFGQLGTGDNVARQTPYDISSQFGSAITQITAGVYHSAVMSASGDIYTWGLNDNGQLGTGGSSSNQPQDITASFGSDTISLVSAGYHYTVALTTTGRVYGWGHNSNGEFGNGASANLATPQDLGHSNIKDIATGNYHMMYLTNSDELYTAGLNDYGQLGNNNLGTNENTLQNITSYFGTNKITRLFTRAYSNFVLTESGLVYTWGNNGNMQLGDGSNTHQATPQESITDFSLDVYPEIQVESIYFGSSKVEQFQVIDANTISLIVPAHQTGFVDVIVNDINGRTTTLASGYEYITIGAPNTGVNL